MSESSSQASKGSVPLTAADGAFSTPSAGGSWQFGLTLTAVGEFPSVATAVAEDVLAEGHRFMLAVANKWRDTLARTQQQQHQQQQAGVGGGGGGHLAVGQQVLSTMADQWRGMMGLNPGSQLEATRKASRRGLAEKLDMGSSFGPTTTAAEPAPSASWTPLPCTHHRDGWHPAGQDYDDDNSSSSSSSSSCGSAAASTGTPFAASCYCAHQQQQQPEPSVGRTAVFWLQQQVIQQEGQCATPCATTKTTDDGALSGYSSGAASCRDVEMTDATEVDVDADGDDDDDDGDGLEFFWLTALPAAAGGVEARLGSAPAAAVVGPSRRVIATAAVSSATLVAFGSVFLCVEETVPVGREPRVDYEFCFDVPVSTTPRRRHVPTLLVAAPTVAPQQSKPLLPGMTGSYGRELATPFRLQQQRSGQQQQWQSAMQRWQAQQQQQRPPPPPQPQQVQPQGPLPPPPPPQQQQLQLRSQTLSSSPPLKAQAERPHLQRPPQSQSRLPEAMTTAVKLPQSQTPQRLQVQSQMPQRQQQLRAPSQPQPQPLAVKPQVPRPLTTPSQLPQTPKTSSQTTQLTPALTPKKTPQQQQQQPLKAQSLKPPPTPRSLTQAQTQRSQQQPQAQAQRHQTQTQTQAQQAKVETQQSSPMRPLRPQSQQVKAAPRAQSPKPLLVKTLVTQRGGLPLSPPRLQSQQQQPTQRPGASPSPSKSMSTSNSSRPSYMRSTEASCAKALDCLSQLAAAAAAQAKSWRAF
ncbi:hypothetical protein PLESTF_001048800 [Pleodorina starrii]|nr:hypothetical protein PLESTF_001048800 [Pleodorina starrii]